MKTKHRTAPREQHTADPEPEGPEQDAAVPADDEPQARSKARTPAVEPDDLGGGTAESDEAEAKDRTGKSSDSGDAEAGSGKDASAEPRGRETEDLDAEPADSDETVDEGAERKARGPRRTKAKGIASTPSDADAVEEEGSKDNAQGSDETEGEDPQDDTDSSGSGEARAESGVEAKRGAKAKGEAKAKRDADTRARARARARDAEADDADTDTADAADTGEAVPERNSKRTAALVMALVAAVCAAYFGWSWYSAAHDESLRYSQARDEALRAGEQAIQNLNTLDYRNLDEGLKIWQDSSTSELYREIVQGRSQFEQAVRKAQTITSAKVLDAAVTELDRHAGKASVIVALQVTVTPPKGEPAIRKTRLVGQLTRTSTGWKLSALAQAPVGSGG